MGNIYQPILDAWASRWVQSFGYIGYNTRLDAINELFSSLKDSGFDWYQDSDRQAIESLVIKMCTPPKDTKHKKKVEWVEEAKLDIMRAAGAVFAKDVKLSALTPMPKVPDIKFRPMPKAPDIKIPPMPKAPDIKVQPEEEDFSDDTPVRSAKIDSNRVDEFRRMFFDNKTDEDFYGK